MRDTYILPLRSPLLGELAEPTAVEVGVVADLVLYASLRVNLELYEGSHYCLNRCY